MSSEILHTVAPISFGDCWPIRKNILTDRPHKTELLNILGATTLLHNMRPPLYTFRSTHRAPTTDQAAARRATLHDAFREGGGHLGRFDGDTEFELRLLDAVPRPHHTPEHAERKRAQIPLIEEERIKSFSRQLDRLNELAEAEDKLWVAFDTPDAHAGHMAVGKVAGFVLGHKQAGQMFPLPVVEGQGAVRGTLPPTYPRAWPLLAR